MYKTSVSLEVGKPRTQFKKGQQTQKSSALFLVIFTEVGETLCLRHPARFSQFLEGIIEKWCLNILKSSCTDSLKSVPCAMNTSVFTQISVSFRMHLTSFLTSNSLNYGTLRTLISTYLNLPINDIKERNCKQNFRL